MVVFDFYFTYVGEFTMKAHLHRHGWSSYKQRRPEPTAYDFDKNDLATIGDVATTFYELDISSIVPSDTVCVVVRIRIKDGAAAGYVRVRTFGNIGTKDLIQQVVNVANMPIEAFGICAVTKTLSLEFACDPKASDWTEFNITILGWWLS